MTTLVRPLITEKSLSGKYAFEVAKFATKPGIKKAVESQFGVNVVKIRTITLTEKPKKNPKTRRVQPGRKYKKAIVVLKKDQKIAIFDTTT